MSCVRITKASRYRKTKNLFLYTIAELLSKFTFLLDLFTVELQIIIARNLNKTLI